MREIIGITATIVAVAAGLAAQIGPGVGVPGIGVIAYPIGIAAAGISIGAFILDRDT